MRKILTILMLLALTVPAWAGTQTITITRNDGQYAGSNGVYYYTKGGVTMSISGGMNNPNFLLLKHENHISFRSANYAIKEIIFHCLDNFQEDNLDVFYWGPTTMDVMTVRLQGNDVTPGRYTAPYNNNSYDGYWNSRCSNGYTDAQGRVHTSYPNGYPAGSTLTFESKGKPIRFASIDIVIEKETGDIFELVTSQNEISTGTPYMLVGRESANATEGYAMNVDKTELSSDDVKSTPVNLIDEGLRVKANSETQFIRLEETGNDNYPYYLKAGSNYIKSQTSQISTTGLRGYRLQKVGSLVNSQLGCFRTKVTINTNGIITNWGYYASIKYEGGVNAGGTDFTNYAIRHIGQYENTNYYYFRNNYDQSYSERRVYLYKPAQQYKVTTEVKPEASYGNISLSDGILVDNGTNWSQKMDTVQFLVTAADGKKIANVDIQALENNQVVEHINPLTISQTINGTLYTFVMPSHDVNIVATFEDVVYHNINMVVKPRSVCGNIFITEGYVVQNDQVKSYNGQNVVFNVTPNPINPADESEGYYELSYVTITDNVTGIETTLVPDAQGNYTFTMPDNEVTITAYFYDNTKSPLWLLGTANGNETWHTYGPRFNYDDETDEYYIDVYFKGVGNYGDTDATSDNHGYFNVTWKTDPDDNWGNINGNRGGASYSNRPIDEESTDTYLCYGQQYDEWGNWIQNFYDNAFKIEAGIYRIYVGTAASEGKQGLKQNQVKVEKYQTTLTFDPAGGADASSAVEVPQNQLVALQGDLYNKIKAINPDEADANFMYKATVDGSTTTTESAGASTSQIATLDVVNEGETVTQLEGWNYLGWIVANNTGYYKVIDTPLHWIEENGEKGKTYTVSDRLQGVYAQGSSLWCKDLGDISIIKTTPAEGQIDFLMKDSHCKREGGWDQSNWVELDFSGFGAQGNEKAAALKDHFIKAKTVTGVYSDDVNYTITLTAAPEADGDTTYVPNTYCTANFLESNLMSGTSAGPTINGTTYYFLNPKIQEYAIITYAMWDKLNQIMVIPDNNPFSGAACIGRWDLNQYDNQLTALDAAFDASCNNQYEFHIIVQRTDKSYGTPAAATQQGAPALKDAPSLKPEQTASAVLRTQPLDLKADSPLPTAITRVGTEAQPVSVEYVNIAGVRSSKPWQGVNIVVTRYSDGTTTTAKVVK